MAPKNLQDKKRKRIEAGSSERTFDASKFRSYTHDKRRYHEIVEKRNIIQEKGFNLNADQFPALQEEIRQSKCQTLTTFPTDSSPELVKEHYTNAYKEDHDDTHFLDFVQGKKVHCERQEPILKLMQPSQEQRQQTAAETLAQEQPGAPHQLPTSQLEQRIVLIEQRQTQLQQDHIRLEHGQARIERSLQSMSHLLALIYRSQRNSELMLRAIAPQFGFSDSSLGGSPLGPLSEQDILQMVHFEDDDEPTTIPATSEN